MSCAINRPSSCRLKAASLINLFGSINISPDEYYDGSVPPRDNIGIETEDESNRQNSGTNSYV